MGPAQAAVAGTKAFTVLRVHKQAIGKREQDTKPS